MLDIREDRYKYYIHTHIHTYIHQAMAYDMLDIREDRYKYAYANNKGEEIAKEVCVHIYMCVCVYVCVCTHSHTNTCMLTTREKR